MILQCLTPLLNPFNNNKYSYIFYNYFLEKTLNCDIDNSNNSPYIKLKKKYVLLYAKIIKFGLNES